MHGANGAWFAARVRAHPLSLEAMQQPPLFLDHLFGAMTALDPVARFEKRLSGAGESFKDGAGQQGRGKRDESPATLL